MNEFRKQISLFVPVSQWLAIRHEAARRKIPITELCRQWMRPKLDALVAREEKPLARCSTGRCSSP